MATSNDREEIPYPLTQEVFFDVLNQGLIPILKDLRSLTMDSHSLLSEQLSDQLSIQLQALDTFHQELLEEMTGYAARMDKGFASASFNQFVERSQKTLEKYRGSLLGMRTWIKGERFIHDLPPYLEGTREMLKTARHNRAHGFNGCDPTISLEEALANPVYATGLFHSHLFGDHNFPPSLPHLDSAVYTFIMVADKIINTGSFLIESEKKKLIQLLADLSKGVASSRPSLIS